MATTKTTNNKPAKKKTAQLDPAKKKRLEGKGWKFGSADEFLGLTSEESTIVDIRLALADLIKAKRQSRQFSQSAMAKAISSSQSRVAKMEAADPSVSVDLLIRSLVGIGVSRKDIGKVISGQ